MKYLLDTQLFFSKMNNYFKNEGWYKPKLNNVDSKLTQLEKYNIRLIKNYETGYD